MKTSILTTSKYWLSDRFKENILGDIEEVADYPFETTKHLILEENSYDSEILKKATTYTREQVLAVLIKLTQDDGSYLLKDCKSNIFYVETGSRTLVVRARLDDGVWRFYCFGLDERGKWAAGRLVSVPAMVENQTLGNDSLTFGDLDTAIKVVKEAGYLVYKPA